MRTRLNSSFKYSKAVSCTLGCSCVAYWWVQNCQSIDLYFKTGIPLLLFHTDEKEDTDQQFASGIVSQVASAFRARQLNQTLMQLNWYLFALFINSKRNSRLFSVAGTMIDAVSRSLRFCSNLENVKLRGWIIQKMCLKPTSRPMDRSRNSTSVCQCRIEMTGPWSLLIERLKKKLEKTKKQT